METLSAMRLVVNTQTPLLRFVDGERKLTTGGVVRMLVPLVQRWQASGAVADAHWVAMASEGATPAVEHDGLKLRFVALPDEEKRGYAQVKERMWALLNSNPGSAPPHGEGGLPEQAWQAFEAYQRLSARAMAEAAADMGGVDLLYVHDFQQLGVAAAWDGPDVPKVFHLHTPFPSVLPEGWAHHLVSQMRRYDAVIVSTRRYAENLRAAGLDVPLHVVHPFIDPHAYAFAVEKDVEAFRARFGIAPDDRVILNVGRMDPMKGQDRLVRAMVRVLREEPRARLLLVGNGSFSSSRRGGLGLDKGRQWRAHLEALAARLGVAHRVTFTGHLGDDLLPAAYQACEVFALPSTREGFGLAAVEAWRHERPVVVADRAGVSELVEDGVNGHSVDCTQRGALSDALLRLLRDEEAARAMGKAGFGTSRLATIDVGREALERVFASVREERAYAVA